MQKKITKALQIFTLAALVAILFLGAKSSPLAQSEKLYPVVEIKSATTSTAKNIKLKPKNLASKVTVTPAKNKASPFVPILPATTTQAPEIVKVAPVVKAPAKSLEQLKINVTAYSDNITPLAQAEVEHCKALVEQTIAALPEELTASLDDLKLFFDTKRGRGLSNSRLIELRCAGLSDTEVVSVFVHELGHIVDLGYFKGQNWEASAFRDGSAAIWADDASVEFYNLSWTDEKTQKLAVERRDFVSGYAMSDPFEDFAESFDLYVLHGADFRALAKESYLLQAKYDFIRDKVFSGKEFDSERSTKDNVRVWDVTLLPYDQAEFFARVS